MFALVDAPPSGRLGRGLRGPLSARPIAGAYAVVERRADVPPVELGSLRAHQAVVARLANAVRAILPVRFGTLLEEATLDETLGERSEDVAEALALVRDRVQFTWRRSRPLVGGTKPAVRGPNGPARSNGTQYMRELARAARSVPPAAFRAPREKLRALVAAERYGTATASMPDSLYHLVDRQRAGRYESIARKVASKTPGLRMTGPFPAFAFTPDFL